MDLTGVLKNSRHHAYCIEGRADKTRAELVPIIKEKWLMAVQGDPDFLDRTFAVMGVAEARQIKEFQEKKAFGAARAILIEADSITIQAQHALLKMFEEPVEHTRFFIIGPCVKSFIPTLDSRLFRIRSAEERDLDREAGEFISASLAGRLKIAKDIADGIKSERRPKTDAVKFLQDVEFLLYQKGVISETARGSLEGIQRCLDYVRDQSASVKMLLEYAALIAG
ncbi:hypothetical protein KGQ31_00190 [Patescibacteria group bacterium]|nr:hypothetical protein [Patescibacteria group bacterium]